MKTSLLLAAGLLFATGAIGVTQFGSTRSPCAANPAEPVAPAAEPGPRALDLAMPSAAARTMPDAVPVPPGSGFFVLPHGRRFEHRFEIALESSMTLGDPPQPVELETRVEGRMVVLVAATEDERVALQIALEDVDLALEGTNTELTEEQRQAAVEAFESTSFVLMASDGRTLGYRFADDAQLEVRNLVRSLWTALHCVVPTAGTTQCTVEDADASGPFQVHFAWESTPDASGSGVLQKTRTPLAESETEGAETRGSGKATLALGLRWPTEVAYEEAGTLSQPEMGLTAEQSARYVFELVGSDFADPSSIPSVTLDGEWASLSGLEDAGATAASLPRRVKHDLAQTSLDDLLAEMGALIAAEQVPSRELYDACRSLAELLRRDPTQLARLAELFESGTLDGALAQYLLATVGSVEGPAAEAFLVARIGDARMPEFQAFALGAAMQVERPGQELLDAVRGMAASRAVDDPLYADGLLALGALASRPSGASALEFLVAEEERAEDAQELILWLAALGNSGNPAVVAEVEPHLSHADAEVRATAAAALRHVMTAEAVALLRRVSLGDASGDVRGTAVEILAQRAVATDNEAVVLVLERDGDVGVRRRAVEGLGRRAPRDDFALLQLLDVSSSDADEDLRALASSYVNG